MPSPPGDAPSLVPGMQLGKYKLIRQLAVGGMAEVHLASATGIEGFEKLVVLKRILPQHAKNRLFVSMFLDEARLAATLVHPNVVQVFDIGVEQGHHYFAMEYVQGHDIRGLLSQAQRAKEPVPLGCAIAMVLDVCRGLHYAHERRDAGGKPLGIVHRDVTPSNVIVTPDGVAKLLDFGVAKAASHTTETHAGSLKGKIAYMSPEQCRGEVIDRRTDVFALGIMLFELTTGTRLFKGPSDLAILNTIASKDAPSPASRRADYPHELEKIVMRALARDREQRYPTAMALARDLEGFARQERLAVSTLDVADFMARLFPPTHALSPDLSASRGAPHGKRLTRRDDEPSVLIVDYVDETEAGKLSSRMPRPELALPAPEPSAVPAAPPAFVADEQLHLDPPTTPSQRAARRAETEPLPAPRRWPYLVAGAAAASLVVLLTGVFGARPEPQPQPLPAAVQTPPPLPPPPAPVQAAPAPVEAEPEPEIAIEPEPIEKPVEKKASKKPKKPAEDKKPAATDKQWNPDSPFLPE